ncbi:MAG: 3-oxoacyl-[acyl-carrier-protein] synthase III C-terminal domain-containing protein [Thermodesulfobacteriota bacterium]
MDLGLVSYGLYLPPGRETAEQIAARSGLDPRLVREELGVEEKPWPGPDDQPVPMAVRAAKSALASGRVDPNQVDLVLWVGEEYKDYIAQTAAIRLQEEVGCGRAWAFDLVGQGVTQVLGLRVARDLMLGDPGIETVLLAGGARHIDLVDYRNPHTRFLLPYSASGGAMILRRGLDRNRLLGWAVRVDADMADEVYVPGGGTLHPFAPDNLDSPLMFFHAPRPERLETYLDEVFPERLAQVVEAALAEAGLDGLDYLALRHLAPGLRRRVLDRLNLPEECSLPLVRFGHHGANDPLISLDAGLSSGAIRGGARVVLAAAGIGFTYMAAVIQWGK